MAIDAHIGRRLLGRRQALGLFVAGLLPAGVVAADLPRRIAVIDWAMLETLMALGVTPIAATELVQFRKDAVEPDIPETVEDLGLRGSPNFELLHLLRPDLILISPFYTRHQPMLETISPVFSLPFYTRGEPPYAKALAAVSALGKVIGKEQLASAVLAQQAAFIEQQRASLMPFAARPTYLINIGDARHFRAFGADSMFGDILDRLGLPNAWSDRSRFTFAAPVPIENLAANPEARIVIISDIPVEARSGLRDSMIWRSLEPVKRNRVVNIANINPYGGITAGLRFARLLGEALSQAGERL